MSKPVQHTTLDRWMEAAPPPPPPLKAFFSTSPRSGIEFLDDFEEPRSPIHHQTEARRRHHPKFAQDGWTMHPGGSAICHGEHLLEIEDDDGAEARQGPEDVPFATATATSDETDALLERPATSSQSSSADSRPTRANPVPLIGVSSEAQQAHFRMPSSSVHASRSCPLFVRIPVVGVCHTLARLGRSLGNCVASAHQHTMKAMKPGPAPPPRRAATSSSRRTPPRATGAEACDEDYEAASLESSRLSASSSAASAASSARDDDATTMMFDLEAGLGSPPALLGAISPPESSPSGQGAVGPSSPAAVDVMIGDDCTTAADCGTARRRRPHHHHAAPAPVVLDRAPQPCPPKPVAAAVPQALLPAPALLDINTIVLQQKTVALDEVDEWGWFVDLT